MGLGYWHVTVTMSKKNKPRENGGFLAGFCDCEWKYETAHITIYTKAIRHLSKEAIEEVVIHELVHVFLNEMREDGIDHEERVATQLQKAFSWVKGAGNE
jgi:hypothetical protein